MMPLSFHLLRPYWLAALIPVLGLGWALWRHTPTHQAWARLCDAHLLPHLLKKSGSHNNKRAFIPLFSALICMVLSLTGPTVSQLPTPTYVPQLARVIVLDLSHTMLAQDITPTRLQRAKFKLHDLFQKPNSGQFALIVYTGEPFVVSPLTDDAQTIEALIGALTPDMMPIGGNRLDLALNEARDLITQSGQTQGQILVLTAETPSPQAIETAHALAKKDISTSVLPLTLKKQHDALFKQLAQVGKGHLIPFSDTSNDMTQWILDTSHEQTFRATHHDRVPRWRDDGRWLLLPALILLAPTFRRYWLHRIRP